MAQWVAPSIAAEIWGVSVEHILAGIADGSIRSNVDGEFLFVDVDRGGYSCSAPRPKPALSDAEFAALTSVPINRLDDLPMVDGDAQLEADHGEHDVSLWREAREETARLRRPPQSKAA